nr:YqaJ viral recombinase family protein [Luteimonas sp. XNQY3]
MHRAAHLNASDAPAMLGISPYKARSELLRETATGVSAEIDEATKRRFDDGHRYEALARPLAEGIVGEDLFPCVGTEGKYSASFDGLTLMADAAFEHKSLNDVLRAAMVDGCKGADLPEHYRVQMEHQCMVSGAESVLFMASKWDGDTLVEQRHCWYYADLDLRERIVAGWTQFEADVAAYEPEASKAVPVAAPIAGFGALSLRVEGRIIASNLDVFKAGADEFIARLPKPEDLRTDHDFAVAKSAVKACEEAEARLKAGKEAAQAEMTDIDAAFRMVDSVAQTICAARLALDKVVKVEEQARKEAIVANGAKAVREHFDGINASLDEHLIQPPQSLHLDLAAAIKGKKSLSRMQDAVGAAVANAKIAASQQADRVRANVAILAEHAEHAHLFADRVALCASKAPDDLRNLVAARVAEAQRVEAERLEQQREQIRQEEAARLQREQQAEAERVERERAAQSESVGNAEPAAAPAPIAADTAERGTAPAAPTGDAGVPSLGERIAAAVKSDARIKLGDINARIAPLAITADGLAQLGFPSVGTERAAKLYRESDFPLICAALALLLSNAAEQKAAA